MSGFIDLQVNGYAGVDFNTAEIDAEQMRSACQRLIDDGNASALATVITDSLESMVAKIAAIAGFMEQDEVVAKVIKGIHVEGPFINPADGFVGAHPKHAVVQASLEFAKRLLDAGRGNVMMMTLAPEVDPVGEVTRFLSDQSVVVAAGHCDASLDQLKCGIDNGLRMFTHLGNGCPAKLPRHDNIIQRVLSLSNQMMISFIADGHHVPDFALANYLHCVPDENVIIVTDAISAAGQGPGRYRLAGQVVEVDPDGAAWAEGRQHFAGCATTMNRMVEILKSRLAASDDQLELWTRANPQRLLAAANR